MPLPLSFFGAIFFFNSIKKETFMNKKLLKIFSFLCFVTLASVLFAGCKQNTEKVSETASPESVSEDGFYIINYEPMGSLPTNVKYPSIFIQFSEPVVALSALGTPSDTSDIFTIEPPLKGTFRWYGTSLLSFDCEEEVIPQRQYTVKIKKDLKSIHGTQLQGMNEFSFKTEELALVNIIPGYEMQQNGTFVDSDDVPLAAAKDIAAFFSYPVNAKVISEYISVKKVGGEEYKTSISAIDGVENAVRISVTGEIPEDSDIEVVLKQGAMSDKGFLGTESIQSISFHTLLPLDLDDYYTDGSSYGKYSNPVRFYYTHPLAESGVDYLVKNIQTEPAMEITKDNVEISGSRLTIYGLPVKYEQDYYLTIPEGIEDIYGRKTKSPSTISVHVPAAASMANFKDYGSGVLEAQFDPKLAFAYQNISEGSWYSVNGQVTSFDPNNVPKNTRVVETVDLRPFLKKSGNKYFGTINFDAAMQIQSNSGDDQPYFYTQRNNQTIQVTDLAATVRYGYNKVVVLVTSLETGKPIANADVSCGFENYDINSVLSQKPGKALTLGKTKTNEKGFAVINLKDNEYKALKDSLSSSKKNCFYVEVNSGDDRLVFEPNTTYLWQYDVYNISNVEGAEEINEKVFLFTDRGLYKPGEKITFRGIDRTLQRGKYSVRGNREYKVEILENGWKGKTLYTEKGKTTESGGFWGDWTLPKDLEPGDYRIRISGLSDSSIDTYANFTVAYFERLRFSATASISDDFTYIRGDRIDANIQASYLGGGSLAGSTYTTSWFREPTYFVPQGQNYKDFSFGPILGYDNRSYLGDDSGVLGASGNGSSSMTSGSETLKGKPYQYRAQMRVTDSGNQEISSSASVIVHPAQFYIGLKRDTNTRGFPKKGQEQTFSFVLSSPNGDAVNSNLFPSKKESQTITVELLREEWKLVQQMGVYGTINTRYVREMVTDSTQTIPLAANGTFTVKPEKGGCYIVRASSTDKKGNDVVTESRFYATGSDWYYYSDQSDQLNLMCDKEIYEIGETAQIMLQSPIEKGTYLMTIEREGIFSEEILEIDESVSVLEVPITEDYLPVVYVALSTYSQRSGEPSTDFDTPDMNKPKSYFGVTPIHVSTKSVSFDVEIIADKSSYRPGEEATVTLKATKNGQPLSDAELTLMAVDRGVVDLINYHVPDPVEFFYSERVFSNCIKGGDSRSILIDPVTYASKNLFGGDEGEDDKIDERKNFDPTAVFVPYLKTGPDGTVKHTFKLPDSLTAYRVTAVGVKDNCFSISESQMDVANPISVRDVLPRRLRVDDTSEVGVVISNLTDSAQNVTVSLELFDGVEQSVQEDDGTILQAGSLAFTGNKEMTITVAANTTEPIFFGVKANREGMATVQFRVNSELVNEKIIKTLEIDKPYVFETVTTIGQTELSDKKSSTSNEKELIIIPGDTDGNEGTLTVQLDSSRLGVLKEAVNYSFHYPYGCLEQRSSAILPLVYFGDYIKVFGLDSEVSNPKRVIEKEIKYWAQSQLPDGSFPYWPGQSTSSFPVSLRIAEILVAAQENDINVSKHINMDKLANYIDKTLQQRNDGNWIYRDAYSNYVLCKMGHPVSKKAIETIENHQDVTVSELCYAGLMYLERGEKEDAERIAKKIKQLTKPTARGVEISMPAKGWSFWYFFSGEIESYALALKFFSLFDVNDEINGRLVYSLLEYQKAGNGYWLNTATTARALDGLNTYIKAFNLEDTNFTAEALVNGKKFVDGKFKGLGALPIENRVDFSQEPVKSLPRDKEIPIEINKTGVGTLFYTISMKYAVPAQKQFARDEGLCVFMDIIDIETGEIVLDGKLKEGKVYKAKVYLSSTKNRTYVAMRVPIPSGAEVLNAAFVTTGSYSQYENTETENDSDDYEKWNYGLSNQVIYDNEVQYFWDYFPRGRQEIDFMFRAVRSGSYQTPGASAECMYQDEIFGRSSGKVFVIED